MCAGVYTCMYDWMDGWMDIYDCMCMYVYVCMYVGRLYSKYSKGPRRAIHHPCL